MLENVASSVHEYHSRHLRLVQSDPVCFNLSGGWREKRSKGWARLAWQQTRYVRGHLHVHSLLCRLRAHDDRQPGGLGTLAAAPLARRAPNLVEVLTLLQPR